MGTKTYPARPEEVGSGVRLSTFWLACCLFLLLLPPPLLARLTVEAEAAAAFVTVV